MLNDDRDSSSGDDRNSCSDGEDISIYSLVSETTDNELKGGAARESNKNKAGGVKLGLLILDGDEDEGGANKGGHAKDTSALLSVPDTVFLPSEIRSVADSRLTQNQDKTLEAEAEVDKGGINIVNIIQEKWSQLSSLASRWKSSGTRIFYSKTLQIVTALLVFMTLMASFSSWRTQAWKSEALHLREELQRQKAMLPYTLSLLKEREALIKKQKMLEEEIEHAKKRNNSGRSKSEDFFLHDESNDESFLSIKNCYVEASLSFGQCSKEWQRWWSETNEGTGGDEEESFEDGFTDDMSRLVKSFKDGLTATTSQSYSYLEKALKDLSYDGIKSAFSIDTFAPDVASNNDTGDM